MPKVILEPDAEGNIVITKETLERLGSNQAELRVEGGRVTIEGKLKKPHEIDNLEERSRAIEDFLKDFAQPSGGKLPDWATLRDDIYN